MSKRLPWYKRDVDAWRGGTRPMSMELRGFYSECLDAMWDLQGPLPNDHAVLAMMLCCNPRTIRTLLPKLVALKKLVLTDDGYINKRMMDEIGETIAPAKDARKPRKLPQEPSANGSQFTVNSAPIGAELEPNSSPIGAEFGSKVPKNPMLSTRELEEEGEEDKEKDSPPTPRAPVLQAGGRNADVKQEPTEPKSTAPITPPPELKSAFNGSTQILLDAVLDWAPNVNRRLGLAADRAFAEKWLTTMLTSNGTAAVIEAHRYVLEKQAAGEVMVSPLVVWSKTAKTIASRPKSEQKQPYRRFGEPVPTKLSQKLDRNTVPHDQAKAMVEDHVGAGCPSTGPFRWRDSWGPPPGAADHWWPEIAKAAFASMGSAR